MENHQKKFIIFVAPVILFIGGLITRWALAPNEEVLDTSFLLMYLLGLGSFWVFFVLFDRFGMFNYGSM